MAYESILYEKQRSGVLITLNRPERLNAFNDQMRNELQLALEEAEQDPAVRAIVLTGAGRAFSAGADMSGGGAAGAKTQWPSGLPEGASVAEFLDSRRVRNRVGVKRLINMWELGKPVIGAINGWAMGWGSWYALWTHITIASENAVFAQPEIRDIAQTNFIWTLLAGPKNALRYGLVGDHVDAEEALRIGLVNKVVPHDHLLEECFQLVERIAHVSPETVKANLQVATQGLEMMGLLNAVNLNIELAAIAQSSQREDFKRHLEEARARGGLREMLEVRDAPFQPEPFGPRSKKRT